MLTAHGGVRPPGSFSGSSGMWVLIIGAAWSLCSVALALVLGDAMRRSANASSFIELDGDLRRLLAAPRSNGPHASTPID